MSSSDTRSLTSRSTGTRPAARWPTDSRYVSSENAQAPTRCSPSLRIPNRGSDATSGVRATSTTVPPGSRTETASLNAPGAAEHSSAAANFIPACSA